jgi:hypothetical protein
MCACGNIETLKRLDDETGKKRSYIHRTYVQKRLDEQAGNRERAWMESCVIIGRHMDMGIGRPSPHLRLCTRVFIRRCTVCPSSS